MRTETATERLRVQEAEFASRKRLHVLQADALTLAYRFAREENGAAGAELVLALKECLQACEALVRDAVSARRRLGAGWDDGAPRRQHVGFLGLLRTKLLEEAADTHREAEVARLASNTRAARRLFGIKNRFEFVAAALTELDAGSEASTT